MFSYAVQILFAWLYSHLLEYALHRFLLHKPKRKKWFKTHFGEHHRSARRYLMLDPKYMGLPKISGDPEIKGLLLLGFLHLPVGYIWPAAYVTLVISALSYYIQHRWQHQSMEYARNNNSWHYDHHMGPNQHSNWGVRLPIFDWVFGTRRVYKGAKRERIKFLLHRQKLEREIHEIRSRRTSGKKP